MVSADWTWQTGHYLGFVGVGLQADELEEPGELIQRHL
jgi:hypothetical protein